MENAEKNLKRLGFTEAQIQVYLAALELGQASIQDLARKSGVKRTSIYNFLDELKERGLIFETRKRKRSVYSAAHPNKLVELGKLQVNELKNSLPELLAVYNRQKTKPHVTFYNGVEGIKHVLADSLETQTPILVWAWYSPQQFEKVLGTYWEEYPRERAKRNILMRSIWRDTPEARVEMKDNMKFLRETKFLPGADTNTDILVYDSKIALFNIQNAPYFAVLIEDKSLADTMRTIWDALWQRL